MPDDVILLSGCARLVHSYGPILSGDTIAHCTGIRASGIRGEPLTGASNAWVTARSAVVSSFSDCQLSFFDPFADLCVEIVEGALQRGLEGSLSGERGGEAWA